MLNDVAQGTEKKYKGMLDCLKQLVKAEGVLGLYQGLGVSILRTMPGAAVQVSHMCAVSVLKR